MLQEMDMFSTGSVEQQVMDEGASLERYNCHGLIISSLVKYFVQYFSTLFSTNSNFFARVNDQ